MKFNKLFKTIAILMTLSMFVSCGNIRGKDNEKADNNISDRENNDKINLELWSHFGGLDEVIAQFEKENPNINVNVKVFTYEEYELEYKKSLVQEEGSADIFMIDSNQFGEFNSVKGLENLLKPEYNAIDYKDDFDKELWEVGKSMDGKELLGLPLASAPIVTYYRADILEKYGFPTDPHELAEFMKDKENWLDMGETLAKDGIHIVQWVGEIIRISTSNMPYFNEKLEYQRDNDKFKEAISISREARKRGLSPYTDIWAEKGLEMLKDDKFAMLYLGSWGSNELEAKVPEQSGKWRVTSLPFGEYGWNNASILSIAENSKNKEAAWKFLEFYNFKYNDKARIGSVSSYLPFRGNEDSYNKKNEFLGGQEEQKFYEEVMAKTQEYPVTALDDETSLLWDEVVNKGIEEDYSDEEIMANIRKEVADRFKKEKEILLNGMEN